MFLRTVKGSSATYLYLVENYRENGKVLQRTILSFGKLSDLNHDEITDLGTKLLSLTNNNTIIDLKHTDEQARKNWGVFEVVEKLWHKFQLSKFFKEELGDRKCKYDIEGAVKLMLADRFCAPCSKLRSFQKQGYYDQAPNIELHNLYKTLEELDSMKPALEKHLFLQCSQQNLAKVDIVYFDVTTFYFESTRRDELRRHGYSKDAKFNEVQVVLSLLVTEDGIPLGYDLFPGNTYEGHTFESSVKRLKESYNINKIIIVADRGLNIGENLLSLATQGFEFIVGTRFKNLGKNLQAKILNLNNYMSMKESMIPVSWRDLISNPVSDEDNVFKYKVIEYIKEIKVGNKKHSLPSKLVCTWSKKRANKDKADRDRLVAKAKNIAEKGDQSDTRGAKKYLTSIEKNTKKTFVLDEAKIEKDAQWDGFYVIETSDAELSVDKILSAYRQLWKIEESFRLYKTHLETRPLFHWKAERIKGHFVMSYIALLFERTIEIELKKHGENIISPTQIRDSLNMMEYSELRCGYQTHKLYAKCDKLGQQILDILKVNIPEMAVPLQK
jgi:transposase